jgi:hypothetical protein
VNGKYRTRRGWMDHELFRRKPFTRLQAWIWLNENAALSTQAPAARAIVPLLLPSAVLGWELTRVHPCPKALRAGNMITTAAATRGTVTTFRNYELHPPTNAGGATPPATARHAHPQRDRNRRKEGHPLQAHTARSNYPPSGLERNGNARHIERRRAGGGVTRGGASVPIGISGTMGM